MLKRICVIVMVLIMIFIQYAGVPVNGLTNSTHNIISTINLSSLSGMPISSIIYNSSSAYNVDQSRKNLNNLYELPQKRLSEERPFLQNLLPWLLRPYPTPQGPFPTMKIYPTPDIIASPSNKTTPQKDIDERPTPTPYESGQQNSEDHSPSQQDPSQQVHENQEPPQQQAQPTPTALENEDQLTTTDISPLVDSLPAMDIESQEYISFKNDMQAIIDKAVKISGINTTYGIYIMDLSTELYFGANENLTRIDEADNVPEGYFNSASVIKLFQGYIFCDMLRKGELDEEKTYYDNVTGRKFSILPMLKSMISYSDNNYSNACLRIVDNKKSNEVLNRLGIKNSRLYGEMSGAIGYSRQNNIKKYGTDKRCARLTPRDAGLILYNVYKNNDSDTYMKALNEGLLGNIYNTRIPVGVHRVSSAYKIAHKTGTNSALGVYNDAGIVYTETPFILVVFTQGTTSAKGQSFIRSLAEQMTIYFSK